MEVDSLLNLLIRPLSGKAFTLEIDYEDTIIEIKEAIWDVVDIDPDMQKLVVNSKELLVGTASDNGLTPNSTVHLLPSLNSGLWNSPRPSVSSRSFEEASCSTSSFPSDSSSSTPSSTRETSSSSSSSSSSPTTPMSPPCALSRIRSENDSLKITSFSKTGLFDSSARKLLLEQTRLYLNEHHHSKNMDGRKSFINRCQRLYRNRSHSKRTAVNTALDCQRSGELNDITRKKMNDLKLRMQKKKGKLKT